MPENDEISLVDIIIVFIRRRYYFLSAFSLSIVVSLFVIWKMGQTDSFLSIYRISSLENISSSSPNTLIASLNNQFYYEEIVNDPKLNLLMRKTKITTPKSSIIVKIETPVTDKSEVEQFQKKILDYLIKEDGKNYQREQNKLLSEMNELNVLLSVRNTSNKVEKNQDELNRLKLKIDSGKPGAVLVHSGSKKALEGTSTRKKIAISFFLSILMGVATVVLVEITSNIRKELRLRKNT